MEYILCAAIYYDDGVKHKGQPVNIDNGFVICGHRHNNCFRTMEMFFGLRKDGIEGFLTSKNRFVNRYDAAKTAFKIGQIKEETDMLISENLY